MFGTFNNEFPLQRVSGTQKKKAEWYANCIDYIIDAGTAFNDRRDTEIKLGILHGDIPQEFYKKTLNPYNSAKERYTRFPATMRNFDIMSDIVRRYVSEYHKGVHEFIVGADNPELVLKKNKRLGEAVFQQAQLDFAREIQRIMQQQQAEMQQSGQQMSQEQMQQQMQQQMPDEEQFIKDFEEKYLDDESKQGQDMLNFVRSCTDDNMVYLSAFFNFVTLGECYTYTDVRGDKIYKESIPVTEAYPIPNTNFFVEDHEMFARRMLLSYQDIVNMFDDVLTDKDKYFLETYYARSGSLGSTQMLRYDQYFENYPDVCTKFNTEERNFFKKNPVNIAADNNNLFEVWHVVWKGEARRGIVTYVNEVGFQSTRVVEEGYQLNPEAGDLDIEWAYEPQVYEGYRIGTRHTAIYPIKARPIAFNRNGKLPYNGIMEVLPMMGKFSIIDAITPYQIMRNIFIYHREMVIAKNKMLILLLPESLIADDTEDKLYRMAADGVLPVDDSEDTNSQKMANIRLLNANMGDYINQLTQLIEAVKQGAREMVDMNMQRYGEIAQHAGATTTQEAVTRSSMGSVILVEVFDMMRCRDYNRDLDYAKLAYVDGLDTAYWNILGERKFISLDVNSFITSDYSTNVKNNQKELEKLNQLKQWAFNASQNGDLQMAVAAITGDNVSQIKATIAKFDELNKQHEEQMKQMEQMLEQEKQQNELAKIQAKGEEDRKTEELKYQYELQLKGIDADIALVGNSLNEPEDANAKQRLAEAAQVSRDNIEQQRLQLDRQKLVADMYNKSADRQVKREDMQNKLAIAKENKNKYDKK